MLSKVFSAATQGVEGVLIEVEVDIAVGMPKEQVVGLPDAAVKESIHRVRAAVTNAGFIWPFNKRVTMNHAPADLPRLLPVHFGTKLLRCRRFCRGHPEFIPNADPDALRLRAVLHGARDPGRPDVPLSDVRRLPDDPSGGAPRRGAGRG